MTTVDFITELFCRVDDAMKDVPKHSQANLYPSELVTIGVLFALKGVGPRAFYRWLVRDYLPLFPTLPDRTRLFRLLTVHSDWTDQFLAPPTVLGVADSYGVELIHSRREGRSQKQIGHKGVSNRRWIVGGKLAVVLNQWGLVAGWDCDTANVYDATFHPMIQPFEERMIVLADTGFHSVISPLSKGAYLLHRPLMNWPRGMRLRLDRKEFGSQAKGSDSPVLLPGV